MPNILVSEMVITPWGESEDLRERMLAATPRSSSENSARNQRERLFAAMVANCATQGYEPTTVGELITVAGVSRRDFYKHFRQGSLLFGHARGDPLWRHHDHRR